MKTKDESLLEIRGASIGIISENSSAEEKFQNQTLRPILKFQNDLFLEVFRNYATKQKGAFYNCFVMILRIKINELFKEFHIKVFNTAQISNAEAAKYYYFIMQE